MPDNFVISQGDLVSVSVGDPVVVGVVTVGGPAGVAGAVGPAGATGATGSAGAAGAAATVAVGSVSTGNAGSSASVTNVGSLSAAVLNFVIPRGEAGAAGSSGPAGAAGATGPVGLSGPAGATGATGSAGSPGAAATVAVGTVTTGSAGSSAVVTNAGTFSAAVLNFTIPQGATGAASTTPGPAGATGPAGPAGTTTWSGLSGVPSPLTAGVNVANGYAGLDGSGLVSSAVLPSYVDDVLEFSALGSFPALGEAGKIYVATGSGKVYRWSGSTYVEISPSPGSTDSVVEGSTNLYYTAARAAAAAPVQSVAGKTGAVSLVKADVGLGSVDNTADVNKPVSAATATALSGKEPTVTAGTPSQYYRGDKSFQTLDKTAVGLSNVDNTSDAGKPVSTATATALAGKVDTSSRNVANGYVGLDSSALIPATYLPSYVDDVLEYAALGNFPATGETGKIYVATGSGKIYRWSGSTYVEISPSPGSTDSVTEGSTNLYFTSARASAAAPVQSVAGRSGAVTLAKADVGLGSVDNTADSVKSVLSASKLTAPVTINGVSFDGSAAITVADSTKEATANKNVANGYVGLDASTLIPAVYLPSYVDDVLEYTNLAGFPASGVTGKIYVALDTNKVFRWSGSAYIEISPSPGSTDSVTEGGTNLYYTAARVDGRITAAAGVSILAYVAPGTAGNVLTSNGSAWTSAAATGGTSETLSPFLLMGS